MAGCSAVVQVVADRARAVRVKDARRVKAVPKAEAAPARAIVRVREVGLVKVGLVKVGLVKVGRAKAVPEVVLPVRVAPVEEGREVATSISIRWSV